MAEVLVSPKKALDDWRSVYPAKLLRSCSTTDEYPRRNGKSTWSRPHDGVLHGRPLRVRSEIVSCLPAGGGCPSTLCELVEFDLQSSHATYEASHDLGQTFCWTNHPGILRTNAPSSATSATTTSPVSRRTPLILRLAIRIQRLLHAIATKSRAGKSAEALFHGWRSRISRWRRTSFAAAHDAQRRIGLLGSRSSCPRSRERPPRAR